MNKVKKMSIIINEFEFEFQMKMSGKIVMNLKV